MSFTFPGYEVEEQLHDGPGSHVHRGRRCADALPVILKVLKPHYPAPERLARLRHEYEILRRLFVPGVVTAYGLETDQRRWVLVQEDIGGESLDRLFATRQLSLTEKLQLALRIAEALGQLHEQKLIHKDINPSNIVWNPASGRLALIDLGIATQLSREHPTLRHPERLEGTLAYIAPEQTGRMNRDIDYRTDFYSLGATLYQLFTGALPFPATEPMELVHCHIARQPTPPHQLVPELPEAISGIILKLMAKMAEDRYQSSYGLKADLTACLERLQSEAPLVDLALGRSDISERFQIPQKLYGREREIEELLASFERVATSPGRAELVLVKGYSGIGKSALVHELHRPITARRGTFAAGKFDQLQRGTPYAAVASAFRSLARQLLGEREERLAVWRERLLAALGPNARVITDVVPEMELILGPQPPVPELGAIEAQNRFNLVFLGFVRALARAEHPLVLFLDDLQWADSASLKLIELLVTDDRPGNLLLIGAYRDNEVDPAHPLMMSVGALRQAGVGPRELHVPPLPLENVTELLADLLHADAGAVGPLAELVLRKTEGNPLFVTQLLKEVHADGLITLDHQGGRWRWDSVRIQERGISDNVVELMVGKLRRQPEATREALRFAACLGNRFGLEALAIIREQSQSDIYTALLPAISEGLVLSDSEPELALPEAAGAPLVAREYRFLHDRVQQAAYSLMDAQERKSVHLRAGRLLLRRIPREEQAERVFEIVDQLNHGRELIHDADERAGIARLNLLAGRKAKAAAAYAAAREYLARGHELLPVEGWEAHYELACSLQRELSEAEALVGNSTRAGALARELLERVRTPLEKAEALNLIVGQLTMLGQNVEALKVARQALSLVDVELPAEEVERALGHEASAIQEKLGSRPMSSLLDAPLVQDARARIVMKLLVSAFPSAFYTDPRVYGLAILKTVRMSLEYGLSAQSADLFAYYGHLLVIQGQYRAGYEAAELSVRLSEKLRSPGDKCRSSFLLADFVLAWTKHLRHAAPINDEGYQAGLEAGEFLFGGYILFYKLLHPFYEGAPIERILADLPAFLQFNQRAKNQLAIDFILGFRRVIGLLTGAPPEETSDADFLRACEQHQSTMAICYFHILRTQALYLLGRCEEALQEAEAAEKVIAAIAGNVAVAEHNLYASLCLAALLPRASPEQRARYAQKLQGNLKTMARWAEGCPENFAHMHALICAEEARASGRQQEASEYYERAIQLAHRNGFAQDEALANELAGRFWMTGGKHRIGVGYLAEALFGYRQWGAHRKVSALVAEFPEVAEQLRLPGPHTTGPHDSSTLDLSSVLKAAHAISSEIVLEKLLTRLMRVVIENAGAERGVLLLEKGGELLARVEASARLADARHDVAVHVLEPTPVSRYEAIAEGIAVYVLRTRETVLLGDAVREGSFTQLPYVVRHRTKSVLAMPLFGGQSKPLGVLYLENNLTAGAFTPSRLEVLKLLSSQIGTSLENALLYSELETRVADRTAELQRKNATLEQALRDLETTQVQLVHAEKMASLGQLTAGIAHELKNPLNFITNFADLNLGMTTELAETLAGNPQARLADVGDLIGELKQNSERIAEHGQRADSIIRSMVQHASGGSRERRRVQLNGLLDQYVNLAYHGMRAQRQHTNILLERNYDPTVNEVELGPQEMGRVFLNLLNNAFDATMERQERDGRAFEPRISVSTRQRADAVEIQVKDNGMGIPTAIRGRIFEPFFTTKPTGSGTGLGLSISYDVVVQGHRGTLTVESTEGQGATFIILLPT